MQTVVINLVSSKTRRAHCRAQFKKAGAPFYFIEAVDGRDKHCAPFDALAYWFNTGRRVSPGEAGCYASHTLAWRHCVQIDEPVIVLEDDCELQGCFAESRGAIEKAVTQCGFLRLEKGGTKCPPSSIYGRFSVSRCIRYPHGTTGYALTPAVAQKFLAGSVPPSAPVDKFIKMYWLHGCPLYSLSPSPVAVSELGDVPHITGRETVRASALQKGRRQIYKIKHFVLRAVFNLRFTDG